MARTRAKERWLIRSSAFSRELIIVDFLEGLLDLFLSFPHSAITEQKKCCVAAFQFP